MRRPCEAAASFVGGGAGRYGPSLDRRAGACRKIERQAAGGNEQSKQRSRHICGAFGARRPEGEKGEDRRTDAKKDWERQAVRVCGMGAAGPVRGRAGG